MRLTLVIPGLLWPQQALADTLRGLDLPALETLLGRAEQRAAPAKTPRAFWQSAFALDHWPAASFRRVGLDCAHADDTHRHWLCADPVHLQLGQQSARIADPHDLALTTEEAAALHAALAPLLAELGELQADTPNAWHLALHQAPPALPDELPVGASADCLLPQGPAARPWRRLMNEIQMALHPHPVNLARATRGLPPVNSLAFWGGGTAPAPQPGPWAALWSNAPVLRGLATCAKRPAAPLPDSFEDFTRHVAASGLPSNPSLVVHWDGLALPSRLRDALQWREALLTLEQAWLQPALASRHLQHLDLVAWGDDGSSIALRLTPWQRFFFWRRPRPLTEFVS